MTYYRVEKAIQNLLKEESPSPLTEFITLKKKEEKVVVSFTLQSGGEIEGCQPIDLLRFVKHLLNESPISCREDTSSISMIERAIHWQLVKQSEEEKHRMWYELYDKNKE